MASSPLRNERRGGRMFDRQWGPLPIESLLHGSARCLWVAARLSNGDVLALLEHERRRLL